MRKLRKLRRHRGSPRREPRNVPRVRRSRRGRAPRQRVGRCDGLPRVRSGLRSSREDRGGPLGLLPHARRGALQPRPRPRPPGERPADLPGAPVRPEGADTDALGHALAHRRERLRPRLDGRREGARRHARQRRARQPARRHPIRERHAALARRRRPRASRLRRAAPPLRVHRCRTDGDELGPRHGRQRRRLPRLRQRRRRRSRRLHHAALGPRLCARLRLQRDRPAGRPPQPEPHDWLRAQHGRAHRDVRLAPLEGRRDATSPSQGRQDHGRVRQLHHAPLAERRRSCRLPLHRAAHRLVRERRVRRDGARVPRHRLRRLDPSHVSVGTRRSRGRIHHRDGRPAFTPPRLPAARPRQEQADRRRAPDRLRPDRLDVHRRARRGLRER